jgi:NAD(P)-dependent dehydrogenase (short-subunit alcohol dehydrogenase family)
MSLSPSYVIFGATGGIGSEVSRQLAAQGARLLLVARGEEKLTQLQTELTHAYPSATIAIRTADVTRSAEIDQAMAHGVELFGTISGTTLLVGSILLKPAHLTTDEEFETTLSLNTRPAFALVRAAAKVMMSTGGSIVLASTVATRIGLTNHEAIAAAKGAVNGLTLAAAATYAPKNIRVNAVAPGLVKTPLAARITSNELALKASIALHPLGRVGEPADVAAAVVWLLNPSTTWVTGQIISVDGGLGSVRAK